MREFMAITKALSDLHHAGLIQSRKTERWVHCRLPDQPVPAAVREALDWVHQSLAGTTEAKADTQRLGKILRMNLKEICRRQCRRRGC